MKPVYLFSTFLMVLNLTLFSSDNISVEGGFMYNAWAENRSEQLLKLYIKSETAAATHHHPLQVIFCIDASQQMSGSPLTYAKKSVAQSIPMLSNEDLVSVISYNGKPKVEVPLKRLVGSTKKIAARAVDLIKYGNDRNLSLTLGKIEEQLSQFGLKKNACTFVIFITNGNPNKGITDSDKLLQKVIDISTKYQAHFSTFGYHEYFNEDFMIQCATRTGGNAYLIQEDKIKELLHLVGKEVASIRSIAYKNISLELELPSEVKISGMVGGLWKDNRIFIRDMQPNFIKPVIIKLQGRPARSEDIVVNVNFSTMCNMSKKSLRKYIDLKVYSESGGYDQKFAPSLIVYLTLHELVESLHDFKQGKLSRNDCAIALKQKLLALDPTRQQLRSKYFNWCFSLLQYALFAVKNEAIEDKVLVKIINYSLCWFLAGYKIR